MALRDWKALKDRFRERMTREGRWSEFVQRREELKRDGIEPHDAWAIAMREFPPLEDIQVVPEHKKLDVVDIYSDASIAKPPIKFKSESQRGATARAMGVNTRRGPRVDTGKVDGAIFKGRRCSMLKALEWVSNNWRDKQPDLASCPGPNAWYLLQWVQLSSANESSFVQNFLTKLVPNRTQLDAESRFGDDGGMIENIDRIFASLESDN